MNNFVNICRKFLQDGKYKNTNEDQQGRSPNALAEKTVFTLSAEKFLCSFNALFLKADQLSCQRQSLLGAIGVFVITN